MGRKRGEVVTQMPSGVMFSDAPVDTAIGSREPGRLVKRVEQGAGEIAQWTRCLLCKHEAWSSDPPSSRKVT